MTPVPKQKRRINREYMARVRQLPCCARDLSSCCGAMQSHHAGPRAERKGHDDETIALCMDHHYQLHGVVGAFRGWSNAGIKAWEREQIAATQRTLGYVAEEVA